MLSWWSHRAWVIFLWAAPASLPCLAQQLHIGAGASLQLASGQLDLGCHNLQVSGELSLGIGSLRGAGDVLANGSILGGSGMLRLSGDLDAAAALSADSGTVLIEDGCGRSQSAIVGAHGFHRLFLHSAAGRVQILPANSEQRIANSLELEGGVERLQLRSSVAGEVAMLNLASNAAQRVLRVDAQDVGAPADGQYLAPELPGAYDSIDRGNTPRFFSLNDQPVHPVPLFSPAGLVVLMLLIVAISWRQFPVFRRGHS